MRGCGVSRVRILVVVPDTLHGTLAMIHDRHDIPHDHSYLDQTRRVRVEALVRHGRLETCPVDLYV